MPLVRRVILRVCLPAEEFGVRAQEVEVERLREGERIKELGPVKYKAS